MPSVATTSRCTVLLDNRGRVLFKWGHGPVRPNPPSTPQLADELSTCPAVSVHASDQHAGVVLASGEAVLWGWVREGQLGGGNLLDDPLPVKVSPFGCLHRFPILRHAVTYDNGAKIAVVRSLQRGQGQYLATFVRKYAIFYTKQQIPKLGLRDKMTNAPGGIFCCKMSHFRAKIKTLILWKFTDNVDSCPWPRCTTYNFGKSITYKSLTLTYSVAKGKNPRYV